MKLFDKFTVNDLFSIAVLFFALYGLVFNTQYFNISKYGLIIIEVLSVVLYLFVSDKFLQDNSNFRNFLVAFICTASVFVVSLFVQEYWLSVLLFVSIFLGFNRAFN